tara:strand:+ start:80 stop:340 length:261 start_codon:yes stop_codon:yes gene_type:complete
MPRYIYECSSCQKQFEISHGMFHSQHECVLCKRVETITKIPSFTIKKGVDPSSETRTGKVVDEFIKDAKEDLKEQRADLQTEYEDK